MIRQVLPAALLLALWLWWKLRKRQKLHEHRPRNQRMRLHLRMHPGRGHASGLELWLRWGRFASWRESKRTRPSLTRWERIRQPHAHSFYLGRAHHHRGVRVSVQEHGAIIGPPRSKKTALLSRIVMNAPGAVVSTSSKPDMYMLTSGLRAQRGPIWVFNPQGIGGIPSNVRWSPLDGCTEPSVAIRRADAFATAVSSVGMDDGSFWAAKASDAMRGLFSAAALGDHDMRQVGRWAGGSSKGAVGILASHGREDDAVAVAELEGPADKTGATIRMVLTRAVAFLRDPKLAESVTPAAGESFDIDTFLTTGGTLYMLARNEGDESPLAPLFAALASEIQHRAVQLGACMPGARMDPPLLLALDEVTQICPVPLPAWLADSGGQGVSIWTGFHGYAQLRARWKDAGAQTVIDTSNVKIYMPGLADADTLGSLSRLIGDASYGEPSEDRSGWHDVQAPGMIRQLPAGFALLIRGGLSPVIIKVAAGWRHPGYRKLNRRRLAVATVHPAVEPVPVIPDLDLVPELEPAAVAAWSPSDVITRQVNGNGHKSDDGTPWWADK